MWGLQCGDTYTHGDAKSLPRNKYLAYRLGVLFFLNVFECASKSLLPPPTQQADGRRDRSSSAGSQEFTVPRGLFFFFTVLNVNQTDAASSRSVCLFAWVFFFLLIPHLF